MPGDLYDILNISHEATSEEIRKAYKKRALQTHPDRLPVNYTPTEKAAAEDQFRKVNNAYEILKDPQKRQSYDRYGVWPPPAAEAVPTASPYGYPSTFTPRRNDYPRPHNPDPFTLFTDFHFTDPFELFDSFFHDSLGAHSHRHRSRDSRSPRRHTTYDDDHEFGFSRARDMHSGGVNDLMANMIDMHQNMLSASAAFSRMRMGMGLAPMSSHFSSFPSQLLMDSNPGSDNGRWVAESTVSQTVNGVTQTVQKRRDWDGNVHITRTYPDGRKVVTINGVEQHNQAQGYLPPPPPPSAVSNATGNRYLPSPPPPYSPSPNSGEAMNYNTAVAPRLSAHRPIIPIVPSFRNDNTTYENGNGAVPSPIHSSYQSSKRKWWNRHN